MSEYMKINSEEPYELVEDDEVLAYESAVKKIHVKNSLRYKELKIAEEINEEDDSLKIKGLAI